MADELETGPLPGWSIFIAHSGKDSEVARALFDRLYEKAPQLRVFLDLKRLEENWSKELHEALRSSRMSVFLLSKNTTFSNFSYVEEELAITIKVQRRTEGAHQIVPVFLDQTGEEFVPYGLANKQGILAYRLADIGEVAKEVVRRFQGSRPFDVQAVGLNPELDWDPCAANLRRGLFEKLTSLSAPEFEEAIEELNVGLKHAPSLHSRATRAVEVINYFIQQGLNLDPVDEAVEKVRSDRRRNRSSASARNRSVLAEHNARNDALQHTVTDYLQSLAGSLEGELKNFVRPYGLWGREDPESEIKGLTDDPRHLREKTRKEVRLLSSGSGGASGIARLAAEERKGRIVSDIVSALIRTKQPVVLLGDPGGGKTTTLKFIQAAIAKKGLNRTDALVPVYISLGRAGREIHSPLDLLASLVSHIPNDHRALESYFDYLFRKGRLLLIFDGMDEMPSERYRAHIAILNRFVKRYREHVRLLFACRIDDFSPEFGYKRLILLPFEKKHLREFVSRRLDFPLTIDNNRFKKEKEFIDHLLSESCIGRAATNPMILELVCSFVETRNQWPESRAELFRMHVRSKMAGSSREALGSARFNEEEFESIIQAWAAIAFEIMGKGGTEIPMARAEGILEGHNCGDPVPCGVSAGILVLSPDQSRIGFTHHRLQEYFAAVFVASRHPIMPWEQLLESARWQETLISLVSLAENHPALDILASELESITRIPRDWEEESRLADYLVLAARLMREIGSQPDRLPQGFRLHHERAVVLFAREGSPVAQVKMLRCCHDVPANLPVTEIIEELSGSDNAWVRERALISAARLGPRLVSSTDPFASLLADNFKKEEYLRHPPSYVRLLREPGIESRRPAILGVLACDAFFEIVLQGIIAAPLILLPRLLFPGTPYKRLLSSDVVVPEWVLVVAFLLLVNSLTPFFRRKFDLRRWRQMFRIAGAVMGLWMFYFVATHTEGNLYFPVIVFAGCILVYEVLALIVGQPWFKVRELVGNGILKRTTESSASGKSEAEPWYRSDWMAQVRGLLCILGSIAICAVVFLYGDSFYEFLGSALSAAMRAPVYVPVLVVSGVALFAAWLLFRRREGGNGLKAALGTLLWIGGVLATAFVIEETESYWIGRIVAATLVAALIYFLARLLWKIRGGVGESKPDLPANPDAWILLVKRLKRQPEKQARLINGTSCDTYDMEPEQFLKILRELKGSIGAHPADAAYALAIDEAETLHRQIRDRIRSVSPVSTDDD